MWREYSRRFPAPAGSCSASSTSSGARWLNVWLVRKRVSAGRSWTRLPLPVFVRDPEGRYLEVNRALTEFPGMSREQLLGETVAEVFRESEGAEFRRRDEEMFLHEGRQV
jgi:PAS domain-containing protein